MKIKVGLRINTLWVYLRWHDRSELLIDIMDISLRRCPHYSLATNHSPLPTFWTNFWSPRSFGASAISMAGKKLFAINVLIAVLHQVHRLADFIDLVWLYQYIIWVILTIFAKKKISVSKQFASSSTTFGKRFGNLKKACLCRY